MANSRSTLQSSKVHLTETKLCQRKDFEELKKIPLTKDQQAKTVLQIGASECFCFCFWTNNCGVQIFTYLFTSWSLYNKAQFGTLLEFSDHYESALSFGY